MKPTPLFLLGIFLLTTKISVAQSFAWSKATNYALYDTKGAKFFALSVDTLERLPHSTLDFDSVQVFLEGAVAISPQKTPVWMGAYVVSYTYEQKIYKVDVSTYGGFFYDENAKTFFQIADEKQQSWHEFLSSNMNRLLSFK